jgi:hypothetical protein
MSLFEHFSGITHDDLYSNKERISKVVKKVLEWGSFSSKDEFDTFLLLSSSELNETVNDILVLLKEALGEKKIDEKIGNFINEELPKDEEDETSDADIQKPEIAKPDDEGGPEAGEEAEEVEPETEEPEEELPEMELLGLTQDTYYTLIRKTNDAGELDDLIIQDQEETELLSAKDKGIDIQDNAGFIRLAVDELDMEWADPEVLKRNDLLKTEEDEIEGEEEEVPGETPQEIPPAETKAGEVGGKQMVAPFESVQKVNEGLEDVMKKAGVDISQYLNTGKAIYFRGVTDDIARSIASELVGSIVGTTPMDGIKFYKLILESKIDKTEERIIEGYTIVASGIEDEDTAKKLATEKNGFSTPDPKKEGTFLVLRDEEKE